MTTGDWITITITLGAFAFGYGKLYNKVSTIEKALHKGLKKLRGHKGKIKDHEKRISKLEST